MGSNQFTLEPGTYRIEGRSPGWAINQNKIRLYQVTTPAGIATTDDGREFGGTSAYAELANFVSSSSILFGEITITVNTIFRIEHYVATGFANNSSLGVATGCCQGTEIYTLVKITKIAD